MTAPATEGAVGRRWPVRVPGRTAGARRGGSELPGRTVPAVTAPEGLIRAVAERAAAEGGTWFPELGGQCPRIDVVASQTRPRCFLYRVELTGGGTTRPVMVKVRHSDPSLRRPSLWEDRPVLAPVRVLSDESTAQREYAGLRLIDEALRGQGTDRFGVLRPLAWLPEHAAIVTDFVQQPTLRTALQGATRLRVRDRSRLDATPWANAGAWLRLFHDHRTPLVLPPRTDTAAEVGSLYRQFADFLVDRVGARGVLGELSASGADIATRALPAELPLGTGHGDFVPNNMFTTPEGRITVFDPLPLWRAPVYQDVATLLVGLRTLPVQAVTQGLALPRRSLARYEVGFLRGYFGTDPVPGTAVAAFQLLVLLEKWSALVSRRARDGRVRSQLREARTRVFSRHYHAEARRLLRLLEGSPDAGARGSAH